MVDPHKLKVGDKVYYQPQYLKLDNKFENGIVKEIEHFNGIPTHNIHVVYHCDDDWDRYQDYTGALTGANDLHLGWL